MKKTKALVDVSKGAKGLPTDLEGDDQLAVTITGQMTYFPLCCSTGILKNFTTRPYDPKQHEACIDNPAALSESQREKIEKAKYLDEIIRTVAGNSSFIAPLYFSRWYAMSLIWRKHEFGHDEHGRGAYSGYKAAQVTFFDRTLEDKDPKKGFNFQYNMTYAICHLIEWLREHGDKYGEVLISKPQPGGHGAEVYGCIFTGNIKALRKYHKDRLEIVRGHYLALDDIYAKKAKRPTGEMPACATF